MSWTRTENQSSEQTSHSGSGMTLANPRDGANKRCTHEEAPGASRAPLGDFQPVLFAEAINILLLNAFKAADSKI